MWRRDLAKRLFVARTRLAALLLAMAALAASAPAAQAASFVVADGDVAGFIAAINAANDEAANPGPDTIELAASATYTLDAADNTTEGSNGLPSIASQITINGNGATIERSASAPDFRIFYVAATGELTLNDLTVRGGRATGSGSPADSGGGIYNAQGAVTLTDSTISSNTATSDGGGIYNSGAVTLTNSTVSDNTARDGGGISNSGTVTLTNSIISGNTATRVGGGIFNDFGTLMLTNSIASDNTANNSGGGIFNRRAVTLTNSTVSDNSATFGGGINNDNGTVKVTASTINGNSATVDGGISNYHGTLTLTNSTISGNAANLDGAGGISNYSGTVKVTASIINANGYGGGIRNFGTLTLTNSTVSGNTAISYGGGIYNYLDGTLTLTNSTVNGNTANQVGGGIFNNLGTVRLTNSTISHNTAGNGGGIYNDGTLTLTNSTVSSNSADAIGGDAIGGGIFSKGGSVDLKSTIIGGNAAAFAGPDCSAPLTSQGHNLIGNTSGCSFFPTGSDLTNVAPLLGPLQDNGGPTQTHALLHGSPAIDHIPVASCADAEGNPLTTDQRGSRRPADGDDDGAAACDIGAYEALPCGDQSGDGAVSIVDVAIELQLTVGLLTPTNEYLRLGDLDRNGRVDLEDAMMALGHIVGLAPIAGCGPSAT